MTAIPETRFATVGDDRVAYQVMGDGPRDLIFSEGQWSHLDLCWEIPAMAHFFRRLASFSRLIRFDMRGTGLSDPRPAPARDVQRHWAEDAMAVLRACRSSVAAIAGFNDIGPLALPFAAAYPEHVSGLVLINTTARYSAAPDYPEGHQRGPLDEFVYFGRKHWGTERFVRATQPARAEDPHTLRQLAKLYRAMASPRIYAEGLENHLHMDARGSLSEVRAPTLVMARRNYRFVPVPHSRYIAAHVEGAQFIELPGSEVSPYWESSDLILDHIEEFLTGVRRGGEPERALVAVLFTDIVDSTKRAAELGDKAWRALLDRHDEIQREQIGLFKGRIVDSAGDGTFATFDRPDRALECARALLEALSKLGMPIRAGIHFGDVELRDDGRVGGMTVHIGARVLAQAKPGEVLVSHTVQGILLGSRHHFSARGTHALKGVPGEWPLYALEG
jgi:class 3 adenylate cyclase